MNLSAGAITDLSSVISGLLVLFTLLFLTPLLYHLPQAVLAAVIMLAVVGLINFGAIRHAWRTQRHDGTAAIRYDGSLEFMNAAHFEDVILQARADYPEAKTILVVGDGINSIDATGEDKIRQAALNLRAADVTLAFTSLKKPVREIFARAGLAELIGNENLFDSRGLALQTLQAVSTDDATTEATNDTR